MLRSEHVHLYPFWRDDVKAIQIRLARWGLCRFVHGMVRPQRRSEALALLAELAEEIWSGSFKGKSLSKLFNLIRKEVTNVGPILLKVSYPAGTLIEWSPRRLRHLL